MKAFYSFVLAVLIAFVFIACPGMQPQGPDFYFDRQGQRIEITDPAGQCVIYKVLGDTTYYKIGLFTANYAALKAKIYTAAEAEDALNDIQAALDMQGSTVGSVVTAIITVAAKAAKVGAPEIVLVSQGLGDFKADATPIDDCTWYKLTAYIGGQRNLILAFK